MSHHCEHCCIHCGWTVDFNATKALGYILAFPFMSHDMIHVPKCLLEIGKPSFLFEMNNLMISINNNFI